MGKLTLRQTDIIILARDTEAVDNPIITYLPLTVNLSFVAVVWLVAIAAAALTTIDTAAFAICRFLFTGWGDALRLTWQAINTPLTWEVIYGT